MKKHHGLWIVLGLAATASLAWYFFTPAKKAAPVTKPPAQPAAGSVTPALAQNLNVNQSPAPGSGSVGSNLYSTGKTVITSSPQTDNGWFGSGFLSNVLKTVTTPNQFIGVIINSSIDSNMDADPSGNPYGWYYFLPVASIGSPGGGSYFVREDQVTVK